MPLNKKGKKVKKAMIKHYGSKAEGERVFAASVTSGRVKDVEDKKKKISTSAAPLKKKRTKTKRTKTS